MLVLSRKQQEKIRIGDDIVITILRTKGHTVRLGIEAPGNVRVLRGEIDFDAAEPIPARQQGDESHPEESLPVVQARIPRQQRHQVVAQLATGPLAAMLQRSGVVNSGVVNG